LGRLTSRGPAPAGNRVAGETLWASCAQPSAIMESQPGECPALVRSEMVPATAWGSCPRLSANFRATADVSARRSGGEKPGNLFPRLCSRNSTPVS